jgi:hypothetical protein
MSDDAFDVTLKMTRGTSSDDKDVLKTTVTADSLEELDEKIDAVRERMEGWAGDLREVQPTRDRSLEDDQSTLGVEA